RPGPWHADVRRRAPAGPLAAARADEPGARRLRRVPVHRSAAVTLRRAIAGAAVIGGAIAAYLTVVHYSHVSPVCTTGGCQKVQQSRYAEAAGIPVAVLGLVAYAAVLVTACVRGVAAAVVGATIALAGAVFSA